MPQNFDVRKSAYSQTVPEAEQENFVNMLDEIAPIIEKYGYDYYMLSVHNSKGSQMLTTAISTEDTSQATALLSDAFRTVQEFIQSEIPTAPGGIA